MTRLFFLSFALVSALAAVLAGCSPCCDQGSPDASQTPASNAAPETKSDADEPVEIDDSALNLDSPETPEWVVNEFFRAFFSGDNDAAFALLSSKAQEAQSDRFEVQASDTIRWRVSRKSKARGGRSYVWVDVEDYADSGEIQMDYLAFLLTNEDGMWRIAGFTVGDLAVNFEDSVIESIAQTKGEKDDAPRSALVEEGSVVR